MPQLHSQRMHAVEFQSEDEDEGEVGFAGLFAVMAAASCGLAGMGALVRAPMFQRGMRQFGCLTQPDFR